MTDKPGMTAFDQLAEVRQVQAETGRIYSIMLLRAFRGPATVRAGELVAAGAIGEVVHTVGLGPHRLKHATNARAGLVLRARALRRHPHRHRRAPGRAVPVLHRRPPDAGCCRPRVANRANPDTPGLQDVGDMHLATDRATGMIRVDWFTPDGLPTWGDGRLIIVGTEGYDRAAQIRRHRRPARQRPPVPRRQARACATSTARDVDLPYGRAAARRRPRPHRDRDAAGALLQGDGAGADGAGDGRAEPAVGR